MIDFTEIQYLAVLVATIATMILGFLWYSPLLFGHAWIKEQGKKMEDIGGGGPFTYILTALTALIGVYILALLMTLSDENSISSGLSLGLLLGLSMAAKIGMNFLFESRTWKLYLITIGYHITAYLMAGVILGLM